MCKIQVKTRGRIITKYNDLTTKSRKGNNKMNKQYKEFAKKLLTLLNYKQINDSWIRNTTQITLSRDESDWLKTYNRLPKIETALQKLTDMRLHLSIKPKGTVLRFVNGSQYIYKTTLIKERHWKESDIARLYPEASLYVRNKYYSSGPKAELYRLSLVEKLEKVDKDLSARLQKYQSEEWGAKKESRSIAAKKADKTRKSNLEKKVDDICDEIRELDIEIYDYDNLDALIEDACRHYNELQFERRKCDTFAAIYPFEKVKTNEFYQRITMNYLRHCCTDYENLLEYYFEMVTKEYQDEICSELRYVVNRKIREMHPWIKVY